MDLDSILESIFNGEISMREASKQYKIDRKKLKSELEKKYDPNELKERMAKNKAHSEIQIESDLLRKVILLFLNGMMSSKEAREMLGIKNKETFKNKVNEFLKDNSTDIEVILAFANFKDSKKHVEHSTTYNFRKIAIEMIRKNMTQSQIAVKYDLSPRTISREFEKFKDDEERTFYIFVKNYSNLTMKRQNFSEGEVNALNSYLDVYEQTHQDLLNQPLPKTSTEKLKEKDEERLRKAKASKEGTQKTIASDAGTSVSTLRRAKKRINDDNDAR